jgi:hypothetical protein
LPIVNITGSAKSTLNKIEKYSTENNPLLLNFWSVSNGEIQGNSNLSDVYVLWNKLGESHVKLIQVYEQHQN